MNDTLIERLVVDQLRQGPLAGRIEAHGMLVPGLWHTSCGFWIYTDVDEWWVGVRPNTYLDWEQHPHDNRQFVAKGSVGSIPALVRLIERNTSNLVYTLGEGEDPW